MKIKGITPYGRCNRFSQVAQQGDQHFAEQFGLKWSGIRIVSCSPSLSVILQSGGFHITSSAFRHSSTLRNYRACPLNSSRCTLQLHFTYIKINTCTIRSYNQSYVTIRDVPTPAKFTFGLVTAVNRDQHVRCCYTKPVFRGSQLCPP